LKPADALHEALDLIASVIGILEGLDGRIEVVMIGCERARMSNGERQLEVCEVTPFAFNGLTESGTNQFSLHVAGCQPSSRRKFAGPQQ
jgi:hypothetical protein